MLVLLRWVATLGFAGLVGAGGWFSYKVYFEKQLELRQKNQELAEKALEIQRLEGEVELRDREIARLDLALKLVKVEQRRAQVAVVQQTGSAEDGDLRTRFRFVEVDRNGESLGEAQEFTIEGDLLYVDARVVKFDDVLVEGGEDPLRSSSICLFRRLFGENQKPSEGFPVDAPFERPAAYGGDEDLAGLEAEIWQHFWELANDPVRAAELGIRAAHGEAPSMQLQKGQVYNLTLRASGGLTFTPEPLPAVIDE